MTSEWKLNGMIFGGLALFAGLLYCVLFLTQRRRISDSVSLQLTGALLSAMVGCKLMNIWLGIQFRTEFFSFSSYVTWKEGLFAPIPFWVMIYLFSALTGHFLIYATGHLIREHRRGILTHATRFSYGAAVTTIAATILLTWLLWHAPYAALQERYSHPRMVTHDATERYLTEWLEAEPDSSHAQQLYRTFLEGTTPPAPAE